MRRARKHLTYANVIATITLFLVVAGGAAYAATHLGKNSVGTKQLKKNAVTAAKLKKNAVTAAKIKNGAVTQSSIKPASLQGADISPTVPFGHVVFSTRGHTALPVAEPGKAYPLEATTFSQEAGQALLPVGGVEIEVAPTCLGAKVEGRVVVDQSDPVAAVEPPSVFEVPHGIVAYGQYDASPTTAGPTRKLLTLTPEAFEQPFFAAPAAAVSHSLAIVVTGKCDTGSGLNVVSAGVDVIGNRPN